MGLASVEQRCSDEGAAPLPRNGWLPPAGRAVTRSPRTRPRSPPRTRTRPQLAPGAPVPQPCEDRGMATETPTRTVHGACNLCEAMCGLLLTIESGPDGERVSGIRGNPDDPLSRGHICPKGTALADIYEDPDRLRRPVRRVRPTNGGEDRWEEIGWDEAIELAVTGLADVQDRGRQRRGGRLPRQPDDPQPGRHDPRRPGRQGAEVQEPLLRHLRRPAPPAAGRPPALRPPAAAAGARHRPHRAAAGRRRQPDGLQRQPVDGAGLPAAAARPQGTRRAHGRARPAAYRDREGGRRAPLRAPGQRRGGAPGDGPHALRRGPDPPGRLRRRGRRGARGRRRLHPAVGRAGLRGRRPR